MPRRGSTAQLLDAPFSEEVRHLFGLNCKNARLSAGLSQAAVAELTGVPQPRLSQIEQGRHNLTIETMAVLANAFGRDLIQLLRKPRS